MVIDDVPWDDFKKRFFPDKKSLLTCQGTIYVIRIILIVVSWYWSILFDPFCSKAYDKHEKAKQINVRMPAIVLLNPDSCGSLLRKARKNKDKVELDYWKENAFIYLMGSCVFVFNILSSR